MVVAALSYPAPPLAQPLERDAGAEISGQPGGAAPAKA